MQARLPMERPWGWCVRAGTGNCDGARRRTDATPAADAATETEGHAAARASPDSLRTPVDRLVRADSGFGAREQRVRSTEAA